MKVEVFVSAQLSRELRQQAGLEKMGGIYTVAAVPAEGQTVVVDGKRYIAETVHIVMSATGSLDVAAYIWIGTAS